MKKNKGCQLECVEQKWIGECPCDQSNNIVYVGCDEE